MASWYEVMAIALAMDALIVALFVVLACIDKVRDWACRTILRRLVG